MDIIFSEHLERSTLASYITTIYFHYEGVSIHGTMLCSPLQSQYLADSCAETRIDHRRGGIDEDGVLGMKEIGHLQPEL